MARPESYRTPEFREKGRVNCYKRWPQWDATITDPVARFWMRVDKRGPNECWSWKAPLGTHGYGMVWWQGRGRNPHTVAWELAHGIIAKGVSILHHCDNRACCNVAHLFEGNTKINAQDAADKDRVAYGERHGCHKLTTLEVIGIRRRYAAGGVTQKALARLYSVSRSNITMVVGGHTWKRAKRTAEASACSQTG